MRQTLLSLAALLFSTFLLLLGSGLLGTLLSLKMGISGLADPLIGLIMGGFYAGMMLGGIVCYRIIHRVGHIRAFAAFAALSCAVIMVHGLILSPWIWIVLRIINGMTMMGMFIVIESWLNERAEPRMRGRVFSFYMVISFLGLGLGQFLLNLADVEGLELYFVAGLLFSLCLVPIALSRSVHPQAPQGVRTRLRHLMRLAPFGVGGCFAAGLMFGAFYALGAVYGTNIGLTTGGVSLLMGVAVLSGLVLQWPVGHVSDFYDRLNVLVLLLALVSVISLALALLGDTGMWPLLILAGLMGGVGATIYPVSVAHVTDYVNQQQLVSTSATLIKTYGVGATLGPVGAALLMALIGPQGLFLFIALVCAVAAVITALRRRPAEVAVEDQEPFVAMPRTGSTLISEMDPRTEVEPEEPDWSRQEEPNTDDHRP
ncbi:MFS transporter [Natronospira bacteriovora]|uniref:MFS transporter n=1 Tax=Natronospira bacteriovora TaxID=3069753 RepID=A0ABU0W9Z6_9GAMM|nr:MFS transporter [Natronospira sp. AB-CW4]MDQ2070850.1 MFS transporter [Natronospira sp. AB-CW4]